MLDSVHGSLSGGAQSSAGCDSPPVRYPPLCDSKTCIRDYRAYFDTVCFRCYRPPKPRRLLRSGQVCAILRPERDDNAGGTELGGGGVEGPRDLGFQVVWRDMGSPFVRSAEEIDYQKRLVALLTAVRRRLAVPSGVATNLLALLENLVWFYFNSNQAYW